MQVPKVLGWEGTVLGHSVVKMSRTQPALQDPDQAREPREVLPAPSTAIRLEPGLPGVTATRPGPARHQGFLYSLTPLIHL